MLWYTKKRAYDFETKWYMGWDYVWKRWVRPAFYRWVWCGRRFINGELIFNKKNGGILIHLTKDVTIESAFRYHYGKVAVIIGKLNAGIVVTLFNNRCVKNHTNNFKLLTLNFVSDYFVWSDKERRDTLYNKMVSILGNAYKWSGFSAFESVPGGVKIVDTLPQKTYNWFGVKITFSPCLNNYILLPFKEEETKSFKDFPLQ